MRFDDWKDRVRYQFDSVMARGPVGLIVWLALVALAGIGTISLAVSLFDLDPHRRTFGQILWASTLQTLDAGDLASESGGGGIGFQIAFLLVTLAGLFVVSTLIGVLTAALECQCERLRKGRSRVVESGHTVILGWSSQVFTVISELVKANENQRRARVVILAPEDKVEMEDAIHARIPHTLTTRIVCRTGDPVDPTDLSIVSPTAARSVIILTREDGDPDIRTIKTMLALRNLAEKSGGDFRIVAAIKEPRNLHVAQLASEGSAQLLTADYVTACVSAQICRQSGLSLVCTDLLNFEGDEIYFQEQPELIGCSFGDALLRYETSSVIGLARGGDTQINPPMDLLIRPGDEIVAISEDDDTVTLAQAEPVVQRDQIVEDWSCSSESESLLVLGWNHRASRLLRELGNYVPSGSRAMIISERSIDGDDLWAPEPVADASFVYAHARFGRLFCDLCLGNITDNGLLGPLNLPECIDHAIVLSESDWYDVQEADARTLVALMHLREIAERDGDGHPFTIVSEMLDVRNRELAQVTHADDYIVSDELLSLMMAQVSENHRLYHVFSDLLSPEGSEIYLRPAEGYVALGRPVTYATVVASAREQGQVAIGYRLNGESLDARTTFGVHLNPHKSEAVTLCERDRVIVLSES